MFKMTVFYLRLFVTVAISILPSFFCCCSPSTSTIRCDKVRAFIEAYNNHELDNFLSFLSDDAQIFEIKDKNKIRKLTEWNFAVNSRINVTNLMYADEKVTFIAEIEDDFDKFLGIENRVYDPVVISFKDGLISQMKMTPREDDRIKADKNMKSFIKWAGEKEPQKLAGLMANRKLTFTKENAKQWLDLLKMWHDSTSSRQSI